MFLLLVRRQYGGWPFVLASEEGPFCEGREKKEATQDMLGGPSGPPRPLLLMRGGCRPLALPALEAPGLAD